MLILAIFVSMLCVPTFATNSYVDSSRTTEETVSEILLEENQEHTLLLRLVDFENGDGAIYTIENGVTISETYIDRSLKIITETDYKKMQ